MAAERKLYCLTCTPGRILARHGKCTIAAIDTAVLGKLQAACISKIAVELATFLPCILMESVVDVL